VRNPITHIHAKANCPTGTTIDVYCIVLNTGTYAAYNFLLDNAPGPTYTHVPDFSSTIMYSVPVFGKTGLGNSLHSLVISPFLQNDTDQVLLLFDYAVYTYVIPVSIN
jgi:hypothetical protein